MPIFALDETIALPDPRLADEDGLLAIGGDLRPERLLLAYSRGVFPWPTEGLPLLWFSPDPRMVLRTAEVRVSTSLRKRLRKGALRIQADTAFPRVVRACARAPRPGQKGTWITRDMLDAYVRLHRLGYAHSIEVWRPEADGAAPRLVGGLYGVSVGRAFCGESMFHRETDASKIAFVALARQLERWGFPLVDCQVPTPHLATLGAHPVRRDAFLEELATLVAAPVDPRRWTLDEDIARGELATQRTGPGGPADDGVGETR